jgi:hypothetical protein
VLPFLRAMPGKRNAGADAARIIRGAVYFDNPEGSYYNEPILLKK